MEQERWRRLQRLLDEAWALPPTERGAYLDRHCADPELRRQARALLAADRRAEPFFARLARDSGIADGEPAAADLSGRRVGSYRLVEELGRGGMGVVYRAERVDGGFDHEVAIKLLSMGLAGGEGHRRFVAERQILAGLEHPAIARLLDGGVTEDGTPYFVMERVEGEPIDAWCDARRLGVAERVELLCRLCDAVEYAHRRLVVHRDLKPANVLVGAGGDPKLLDFGVAKLLGDLDPELTGSSAGAPVTPGWAAPEQLAGGAVTTATDTHGLGALAYLLLAGVPLVAAGDRTPAALLRRLDSAPRPPSRRFATLPAVEQERLAAARGTTPRGLRRRLAGDLDAVVARALDPAVERRYGTAGELAADLRAYLAGRPVTAGPPRAGYRLRRFVGRHRLAVVAAAVIAALLAGLVAVSIGSAVTSRRQAARLVAERDRAEAERATAEAVRTFMEDVLLSAEPTTGLGPDATILAGLDRIVERFGDRPISESPAVDASVRLAIGNVYTRLGRFDEAETLVRRAHETRVATLGAEDAEVAETLYELGQIALGRADYTAAAKHFRGALRIRRAGLRPLDPRTGQTLAWLGWALANGGEPDAARTVLEESVALFRARAEPTVELADPLSMLSQVERGEGRGERAEEMAREALVIRRRLLPPDHTKLGESYNNLAVLLDDDGKQEEAVKLYRRAIDIQQAIYGPESPFVAPTLSNLGLLNLLGRFEQAETALVRAWEIDRAAFGADHFYVGIDRQNLARHHCAAGRPAEGREHVEATLAIYRAAFGDGDWRVAAARSILGVCLWRLGATARAEEELRSALVRLEADLGADHVNTELARRRLDEFYRATGRPELAQPSAAVFGRSEP